MLLLTCFDIIALKMEIVTTKGSLRTLFGEEFFYRSQKLIDFVKFILANFWKWEYFFLKMIKRLVKINF